MFSTFFRQALHKNFENLSAATFVTVLYGVNGLLFCRYIKQLEEDNPGCTVTVKTSYIPGVGPYYQFSVEEKNQPKFNPRP